eukprot:Rmarinus@m.656
MDREAGTDTYEALFHCSIRARKADEERDATNRRYADFVAGIRRHVNHTICLLQRVLTKLQEELKEADLIEEVLKQRMACDTTSIQFESVEVISPIIKMNRSQLYEKLQDVHREKQLLLQKIRQVNDFEDMLAPLINMIRDYSSLQSTGSEQTASDSTWMMVGSYSSPSVEGIKQSTSLEESLSVERPLPRSCSSIAVQVGDCLAKPELRLEDLGVEIGALQRMLEEERARILNLEIENQTLVSANGSLKKEVYNLSQQLGMHRTVPATHDRIQPLSFKLASLQTFTDRSSDFSPLSQHNDYSDTCSLSDDCSILDFPTKPVLNDAYLCPFTHSRGAYSWNPAHLVVSGLLATFMLGFDWLTSLGGLMSRMFL